MVNMLASKPEEALPPRDHNRPPNLVELFLEELAKSYKRELAEFELVAGRASAAKQKIDNDEDVKLWSEIYLDASALFKSLDGARINELKPFAAALKLYFGNTLDRAGRVMVSGKKLIDDYNRAKVAKQRAEDEAKQKRLRDEAGQKRRDAEVAAEFGDVDQTIEHAQGAAAIESQIAQTQAEAPKAADVARVRTDSGALSTVATNWKFEIADYSKVDLNALRAFIKPDHIDQAVRAAVRIQKGATKIDGVRVFEDIGTSFRR